MILKTEKTRLHRQSMLQTLAASGAFFTTAGLFAEELTRTARIAEGPFYPVVLPLDTDNDLLLLNDSATPAVGKIAHLGGQVLKQDGSPVRNAFVEIWQVDGNGAYLHTRSSNAEKRDSNFQGYGRFLTDAEGRYYFRTIKPIAYPGRTPHIHVAVSMNDKRVLTTQLLEKGHPQNQRDGLFKRLKTDADRNSVCTTFDPLDGSPLGELQAKFDIVLGQTASEDPGGKLHGVSPKS